MCIHLSHLIHDEIDSEPAMHDDELAQEAKNLHGSADERTAERRYFNFYINPEKLTSTPHAC